MVLQLRACTAHPPLHGWCAQVSVLDIIESDERGEAGAQRLRLPCAGAISSISSAPSLLVSTWCCTVCNTRAGGAWLREQAATRPQPDAPLQAAGAASGQACCACSRPTHVTFNPLDVACSCFTCAAARGCCTHAMMQAQRQRVPWSMRRSLCLCCVCARAGPPASTQPSSGSSFMHRLGGSMRRNRYACVRAGVAA